MSYRPNARVADMKRRRKAKSAPGYVLPSVVVSRIAEAGASAYDWRNKVLSDLYLPTPGVQRALSVAAKVVPGVLLCAVVWTGLSSGGPLFAVLALAVLAAGVGARYLFRRTLALPVPSVWAVAVGVAGLPTMLAIPAMGLIGAAVIVVSSVFSVDSGRASRAVVSGFGTVVLTAVFVQVSLVAQYPLVVAMMWVNALVIFQAFVCLSGRNLRGFAHRVTPADLAVRVPDPEFRWQKMVDVIRKVPGLRFLTSEVLPTGWLSQVMEDPSPSVLSEARKKAAGAYGERKTAVFLLGLSRRVGAVVLHDVALPGATDANIDHVVVTRGSGGEPVAFVIDSKFYGLSRLPSAEHPEGRDPGEVTYDPASEGYVHRVGFQNRSINQSIKTALWGASAVRELTGIADVRVVMAIHNANVSPGLSFMQGEIPVEIMSAWGLVAYIEAESSLRSRGLWSRLARKNDDPLVSLVERFTSASHAGAPVPSVPLGRTEKATAFMASSNAAGRGAMSQAPHGRFGRDTQAFNPPSPRAEEPMAALPPVEASREETPGEWVPPVAPAESAPSRIEGRWMQMQNSTPAAPDDVPERYRSLRRGTALTITGFSETQGPVSKNVVAMSGVCAGEPGVLFVWYCSIEAWNQHQSTRTPVFVSTIAMDRTFLRAEERG